MLERPRQILMLRKIATELARLLAAHAQQTVIRGKEEAIKTDDALVFVVGTVTSTRSQIITLLIINWCIVH